MKPPPHYPNLEQQRQGLLRQLAELRELRRGSLTEQFLTVKHADGSKVRRGPYPLLTRKEAQKTIPVRLSDPALVPLYRRQLQAMRQFETVVDQLVRGRATGRTGGGGGGAKKNCWWNWSKAPRCIVWPQSWAVGRRLISKPGRRSCFRRLATAERESWAACSRSGRPMLPGK